MIVEGQGEAPNGGRGAAAKKEGIGAMTKLDQLYAERDKKFGEICALVARELGHFDFATTNGEDRERVAHEAEQYVKEWEETTELRTRPGIRPVTPLRRLLSEYQSICERILDEQDIEVGLWAYKSGARSRRRLAC